MNNRFKLLLPVGIVLIIFALLVGGRVPYFLLYFYALFLILPFLSGYISLNRLSGSITVPGKELKMGDRITIEYSVKNRSPFSITSLIVINNTSKAITGSSTQPIEISLQGGETHIGREHITANRRGYYTTGDITLVSTDAFGLYSLKRRINSPTELLIYPDPKKLSSFRISASREAGDLIINNLNFRDRSRIDFLREFRDGDSLKTVHWRQSASKESIIVKEFEKRGDANAAIFIDNSKKVLSRDVDRRLEDLEVDIALGIIGHCLDNGVKVTLIHQEGNTLNRTEGSFTSDMKPFLKLLAKLSSNGTHSISDQLEAEVIHLSRGTNIVIISPEVDLSLGRTALDLGTQGLNPIVIGVSDRRNRIGYIDESVEIRLHRDNIPVILLDYSSDFERTLEESHG